MTIPRESDGPWAAHLFSPDELQGCGGGLSQGTIRALIDQQLSTWPALFEAVEGLSQVEQRRLLVSEIPTFVQFNPRRIISTSARVDPATIGSRPCFLCPSNLPPEEKGIPFGDRYVILCNPYPVLPDHLVISARDHVPQSIATTVSDLIDLTAEIGSDWFTLYNGPHCGASAPDHLHFQAGSVAAIPIFNDLDQFDQRHLKRFSIGNAVIAAALPDRSLPLEYRLNLLLLESDDRQALTNVFQESLSLLARLTRVEELEPMINLVVHHDNGVWKLIVIPRGRHRPSCFYAEGDSRMMISPAAIDLSGLFVLPNREDFERITGADLEIISSEVQLDDHIFSEWWRGLTAP